MLDGDECGEETSDLVEAEDDGEPLGLPGAGDADEDVVASEGDLVEESECGSCLVVDAPGDLLVLDEVEEVGADVFASEELGRPPEVPCEGADGARRRRR